MTVLATLRRGRTVVVIRDRELPIRSNVANNTATVKSTKSAPRASNPSTLPNEPGTLDAALQADKDKHRVQGSPNHARWRVDEAERYLRFWAGDGAAMHQLRRALQQVNHGMHLLPLHDQSLIRQLANYLASGVLKVQEGGLPAALPADLRPPATGAAAALPPAPTLPIVMVPSLLSQLPILPLLEEVQIEGADVLPEIMQSLEQVDMTMENIDFASVSLEPTPSRIPDILTTLTDASGSANAVLDAL